MLPTQKPYPAVLMKIVTIVKIPIVILIPLAFINELQAIVELVIRSDNLVVSIVLPVFAFGSVFLPPILMLLSFIYVMLEKWEGINSSKAKVALYYLFWFMLWGAMIVMLIFLGYMADASSHSLREMTLLTSIVPVFILWGLILFSHLVFRKIRTVFQST